MSINLWWRLVTLFFCVQNLQFCALIVSALRCGPCTLDACRPLFPDSCPGGVTTDMCSCCPVCTKLVNQECGGAFGMLGKCGVGLECALTSEIGAPITGNEGGICREIVSTKCANVTCSEPEVISCPKDSIKSTYQSHECCPASFQCVCDQLKCHATSCGLGYNRVLVAKGTGQPGKCCDQYRCQKYERCKSVVCPLVSNLKCPVDSYRLPSLLTPDGCCYIQQECGCRTCPEMRCPAGLKLLVHKKGSGQPGDCCAQFECVARSRFTCRNTTDNRQYEDGATWNEDPCTVCRCRHGITFCKVNNCSNITMCPYMERPDGECCPVCKGCFTEDSLIKKNGETWRDVCKTCRCERGVIQCNQPLCEAHCANPRYIPGKCCPVCEAKCTLSCAHGLAVDSKGQEICECAYPSIVCPSIDSCKKKCAYGLLTTENGCTKCQCNKCPPLITCDKRCRYGYAVNEHGCEICKCRIFPGSHRLVASTLITPTTTTSPSIQAAAIMDGGCLSQEGVHHGSGEMWNDGCRTCHCYHGKEMCSLITCPRLQCDSPVYTDADCCPSCPGVSSTVKGVDHCTTETGINYTEGESWSLDNCTVCLCHQGVVLCEIHTCPPLLCTHPVMREGQCCPSCPDTNRSMKSLSIKTKDVCVTSEGHPYVEGDVWQTSPCQSCTCIAGQIHCFSQSCLATSCEHTIQIKGRCCSLCKDTVPVVCVDGGKTYSEGESWTTHNCTECQCVKGEVKCSPQHCDVPGCKYLVRPHGQCCPTCLGPESVADEPDSTATAVICSLAILTALALVSLVIALYKFHHMRKAELKPNKTDISHPSAVHVQLLGFQKGGNSDQKRKSWTGDVLNAVDKLSLKVDDRSVEEMQRVSLCMDMTDEA